MFKNISFEPNYPKSVWSRKELFMLSKTIVILELAYLYNASHLRETRTKWAMVKVVMLRVLRPGYLWNRDGRIAFITIIYVWKIYLHKKLRMGCNLHLPNRLCHGGGTYLSNISYYISYWILCVRACVLLSPYVPGMYRERDGFYFK